MGQGEDVRRAALESLERKRGFKRFLVVYVLVNAGMVVIWALTGADRANPWPVWVLLGTTIALVVRAWNAYGSGKRPITDAEIDAEVRKLKGG